MIAFILANWKAILTAATGATLGAILAFGWTMAVTVPNARQEGRELGRAAALERSMDIIRERGATNAEIGRMSDADLCTELGGRVQDDGTCR